MENILSRLSNYMKMKGLNNNKITVQAGLSNGLLGNAFKSGKGLNSDSIEKILHTYRDLNAEWLLTGRGEMLKNDLVVSEPLANYEKGEKINYMKLLQEKDEQINKLISMLAKEQETVAILSKSVKGVNVRAKKSKSYTADKVGNAG